MPETTITYKLIAPTIGTDAEWLAKDDSFILPKGVLGTVLDRQYSGQVEFIIGDGSSKYSELVKVGVTLPTDGQADGALLTVDGTGKLVYVSRINASMLDGVINEANLPKTAVATLKVVENQRARFAFTKDDVQKFCDENGLTLHVTEVQDLQSENGAIVYQNMAAGSKVSKGANLRIKVVKNPEVPTTPSDSDTGDTE